MGRAPGHQNQKLGRNHSSIALCGNFPLVSINLLGDVSSYCFPVARRCRATDRRDGHESRAVVERRTEDPGTIAENFPGEHARTLGEDRRRRGNAQQKRLYETLQGNEFSQSVDQ